MIKNLFIKSAASDGRMTSVRSLSATKDGIVGSLRMQEFRQILILPKSTTDEFGIEPGALKENVIVDTPFDIHSLESGTVMILGSVKVRLTFQCEPCAQIKNIVNVRKIMFKRGYLGQILNSGSMSVGDDVAILKEKYEPIPYKHADRIKWYLEKCEEPVTASDLVLNIGLSKSYCRAVPNIIRNRHDIDKSKIIYRNSDKNRTQLELMV